MAQHLWDERSVYKHIQDFIHDRVLNTYVYAELVIVAMAKISK